MAERGTREQSSLLVGISIAMNNVVTVLKLIVPAQFTAILEELVMESAATNQAEWVGVKMRKQIQQIK